MSHHNPTADWEKIGDRFYRKVQLYTGIFPQDVDLGSYHIAAAPYGGAIALYPHEDKLFTYRGSDAKNTKIDVYSCAGKLIRRIPWDNEPIRGLGWSEEEQLIVISQDGTVRCFTGLSQDYSVFSLGHGSEEHGVQSCRFWLSGFVALLGNNTLISVSSYQEPRPKLLARPLFSTNVVSWALVPPAYTLSRSVEVLLAVAKTINVVDSNESEDRMLQNGPFYHVSVSPNGRFIGLYTEDGKVWVISSDWQDKLSEYDTGVKTMPRNMTWCGNDALALAWDDEVHVVGPNGAAAKYYYDGWVHLLPEVDGVKLFTNDVCEFLHKVPDVTEDTFKLGSTSPASVLLDSVSQFAARSPKADENIQLIKTVLTDAVDFCIEAAGHEFSIHWQKQLLRAASFGKAALDLYDSDDYVRKCETLRILNAVRFYEIGLPLSYEQYMRLNPERLIQRLVSRQEYSLSLKVSEFMHLPTDRIYIHWAATKVRTSSAPDDVIAASVVDKLSSRKGISFVEIARAANDDGKATLATKLLIHEPKAGKQVPLLLTMEEDTVALDKAIESGDTDLVLYVLLHLKQKLPQATFFRTLNTRPVAIAVVESTAINEERELLKNFYYQDDRRVDGSNILLMDALSIPDGGNPQAKIDKLKSAVKLIHDSKDTGFQARSLDEMQRLLRTQAELDADANIRVSLGDAEADDSHNKFAGTSLHETIRRLILLGQPKRAQKLVSDFKLSEKSFWWLRLRALVESRDFSTLEDIARANKKSPIGWEPFFNEILAAGNAKTASIFVPKCTGLKWTERYEMYLKCGTPMRAAEEAFKARDRTKLEELRSQVIGSRDDGELERLIGVLAKGR